MLKERNLVRKKNIRFVNANFGKWQGLFSSQKCPITSNLLLLLH
jgi:hypothetical protein